MANCIHCGEKAGFLRRAHKQCATTHREGLQQMEALARQAAATEAFNADAIRRRLAEVAERAFAGEDHITAAIERGWERAVAESLADGVLTQSEENRLRGFRDQLALALDAGAAAAARLDRATAERLRHDARAAAVATDDGERQLEALAETIEQSALPPLGRRELLAEAWEEAVAAVLEDGALSLEEEAALVRYMRHFELSAERVNESGGHTQMVKGAVIREAAEGVVPERLRLDGSVPFNLMKSEQLVWVMEDVDYHEVVTRRERRGTSHGLSIRVAKGLYYRPGMFRSHIREWEETVHLDTGLLGITSKHLYFHGRRKRFRIRYDRIVSFEPYDDGLGVMRDAQTAKPQSFRTGDGWFTYNLVTNLAQQW